MRYQLSSTAHRLEIIDEQKNDQQNLRNFVDNADRLQMKSVDYEIEHERHGSIEDQ